MRVRLVHVGSVRHTCQMHTEGTPQSVKVLTDYASARERVSVIKREHVKDSKGGTQLLLLWLERERSRRGGL